MGEGQDVVYECIRCGTKIIKSELERYIDVKCICGYRVFRKVRPDIVKQIAAV